jgi:hypothetical protein
MQRPGRRERKRAKWCSSNLNSRRPQRPKGAPPKSDRAPCYAAIVDASILPTLDVVTRVALPAVNGSQVATL